MTRNDDQNFKVSTLQRQQYTYCVYRAAHRLQSPLNCPAPECHSPQPSPRPITSLQCLEAYTSGTASPTKPISLTHGARVGCCSSSLEDCLGQWCERSLPRLTSLDRGHRCGTASASEIQSARLRDRSPMAMDGDERLEIRYTCTASRHCTSQMYLRYDAEPELAQDLSRLQYLAYLGAPCPAYIDGLEVPPDRSWIAVPHHTHNQSGILHPPPNSLSLPCRRPNSLNTTLPTHPPAAKTFNVSASASLTP